MTELPPSKDEVGSAPRPSLGVAAFSNGGNAGDGIFRLKAMPGAHPVGLEGQTSSADTSAPDEAMHGSLNNVRRGKCSADHPTLSLVRLLVEAG